ncbi:Manganese ABC transporter substrate-binding lipoprotein precursor [Pelagimonas phthalicica]|uniref:Manganese ABC transporter substrate-binding lipoprotein n=1 Tax=Pelagimonas phthalicica TaxID=1037362 RepID=A0A238JEQ9_9RHOB|nr:zinc ABC transporter substrate-binding protein [Pelagimonas phthalicica]TDS92059.1 zinc/manganese transport system substrate-binding protein [Pelagimonas phthalicica]SMX29109.1 Manganese ABC transporter substrate-binding lipoprotein precursor [Pelagimonas phthalicica]
MKLINSFYAGIASAALALVAGPALAHDVKIVASFSILGDMVEEVVGDMAEVTTIVGPDADAHVYQPSVADARAVAEADVVFVNGLGFETWSDTLIAESGTKAVVHVATEGVTPVMVDGTADPHAWNSLSNGVIYVTNVAAAMKEAMPDHAADIDANAQAYIAKLKALDAETKAKLAGLPAERRTVVTAHDAFGYLADAYGMNFLAPVGIDTEAEPSAKELAELIDQIKSAGAAALFVENITSPALVKQVADETGLEIGGRLFSDALSERGGPATSYLTMFQHNLGTLLEALDKAPAS